MELKQNRLSDYSRIIVAALWLICTLILFFTAQSTALFLKGSLFSLALAGIGVYDATTHIIPNRYLWPVMLIGLIDFKPVPAIAGFFVASFIFYLNNKITKEEVIGCGDIKFIAAAGFVLGTPAVIYAALMGIIFLKIASRLFFQGQRKKHYYAMAPWLGIGCFLAFIIFN
ncbi:A24 family peptidase [Faecalispora jeddahensis]|uniref:A24 family peptidase n=1 Tax=Faecalispora jeddahensis TaxID=1414721 RepID=UPI0028B0E9D9|nr:A24 family peptidase [Faecalispora jeddahensis]